MRAILGAAVAGILILAPACGRSTVISCDACRSPFVMDLLISQDGGVNQVGLFQTLGVRIPGPDRILTPNPADRAMADGLGNAPDGSSLVNVIPMAGWMGGRHQHFGGTVTLSASTSLSESPWTVTIQIATDPLSGHDLHAYVGSGTTVMQLGQTFVMTWAVGSAPPMPSDSTVLRAWTAPIERVTEPFGNGARQPTRYMEQVFVAAATGKAVLTAPTAFDPTRDDKPFGPSQRFIVIDNSSWTCSPAGGCFTPVASADNWRPDHYYPPGITPV
jgi:hypothetical protein